MRTRTDTSLSAGVRGNLIDITSCGHARSNPGVRHDQGFGGNLTARFDAHDRRDMEETISLLVEPPTNVLAACHQVVPPTGGTARSRSGPAYTGDQAFAPA